MWSTVLLWVDRAQPDDHAVRRARNRSQHVIAVLTFLVGLPYAYLLHAGGNTPVAMMALATAIASAVSLFVATRRGRPVIGGVILAVLMMTAIMIALVARGGLHSNSSIWLVLIPLIGAITTGPRTGLLLGGLVAASAFALWTAQSNGVVLTSTLSPDQAWILVVVDHVTVPLAVAIILWGQHTVWTGVVDRLDTTNEALRKEVGERERAEQAAVRAAQTRTTFLATMSHEIRTPLNGVIGITDAILDGPLSTEQRALANTVRQSGELLQTVLNDVLDFTKIDTGAIDLIERPTELAALGQQLHSLWSPRAAANDTHCILQVDDALPAWVRIDDHRLRQVIGNLLSNAVKFTRSGTISLLFTAEEDRLRVVVEDSGPGIAEADLERIFEPFQQLDSSDRRQHGGAGLGLSICRRLVARMGGVLEVSSQQGVGTRFWFTLPLQAATPRPPAADRTRAPALLTGRRVLAAEDNPINQTVLQALFKRFDVSLRMVADGLECIAQCQQELPEIILMDCQMPNCDGYEATRRLRASGVEIPIIAVTASTMPSDRQRSLDAGMNAHLSKPIRAHELEEVLVKWLGEPT